MTYVYARMELKAMGSEKRHIAYKRVVSICCAGDGKRKEARTKHGQLLIRKGVRVPLLVRRHARYALGRGGSSRVGCRHGDYNGRVLSPRKTRQRSDWEIKDDGSCGARVRVKVKVVEKR